MVDARHTHERSGRRSAVGLEFEHVVLRRKSEHLSGEGLYVALARTAKSLTILSRSRPLTPEGT